MEILNSILRAIGNTPLVRLDRLGRNSGIDGVDILGKVEAFNPGGSHKDRMAFRVIEDAEKQGTLKPGMEVVEATSGNLGAGLALVCAVKGYKFVAVMSEVASMERRGMVEALGAEVIVVPRPAALEPDPIERAEEIARERHGFYVNQFFNRSNITAHRETTGKEILEQTDGRIDVFVTGIGSAGTFNGVVGALKAYNPEIRSVVVKPEATNIPGIVPSSVEWPPFYDPSLIDDSVTVTDQEARMGARRLAREEGILAGFSSGANIEGTLRVAKNMEKGQTVVTMIYGTGLKYLSTGLYP